MMTFKKEERWEIRYISKNDGIEKACYPRSKEKKEEQLAIAKEQGVKIVSCKKLYPFSMERNQHNFELIKNRCRNIINDMLMGDVPYNEAEINRLSDLADKADNYWGYELPVAWVPWEELREMKELSTMAINWRMDRCIEKGRPDLIQYCN